MTEHEPGEAWTCNEGHRHFRCAECEQVFTSDPGWSEEDQEAEAVADLGAVPEDDDRISICDNCYGPLLAEARKQGLIP